MAAKAMARRRNVIPFLRADKPQRIGLRENQPTSISRSNRIMMAIAGSALGAVQSGSGCRYVIQFDDPKSRLSAKVEIEKYAWPTASAEFLNNPAKISNAS